MKAVLKDHKEQKAESAASPAARRAACLRRRGITAEAKTIDGLERSDRQQRFVTDHGPVLTCVTLHCKSNQLGRLQMAETVQAKAAETKFQPYVPAEEIRPEFTARAVILGC